LLPSPPPSAGLRRHDRRQPRPRQQNLANPRDDVGLRHPPLVERLQVHEDVKMIDPLRARQVLNRLDAVEPRQIFRHAARCRRRPVERCALWRIEMHRDLSHVLFGNERSAQRSD
jgi:hypothetical protein